MPPRRARLVKLLNLTEYALLIGYLANMYAHHYWLIG
jgi:hypothetical protein